MRGELSPSGIRLADQIVNGETDPLVTLRNGLKNGDLALETVWICLEQHRELRLDRLSKSARIEQIKVDRVGELTLDWLRQDEACWVDVLSNHVLIFDTLCYYLVAEGLQDNIVHMIRTEAPATRGLPIRATWRGMILRSLVKAVLDTETQRSADQAIKLFVEIHDEVVTLRARSKRIHHLGQQEDAYDMTSRHPACTEIGRRLMTNTYPKTSESQFRRFLAVNWTIPRTGKSRQLSCAVLPLYIPNTPEPGPALELFKKWFGDLPEDGGRQLFGTDFKTRKPIYFALCRLENVLLGQERSDDASWVARTRDSLFGKAEQHNFRKMNRYNIAEGSAFIRQVGSHESENIRPRKIQSNNRRTRG